MEHENNVLRVVSAEGAAAVLGLCGNGPRCGEVWRNDQHGTVQAIQCSHEVGSVILSIEVTRSPASDATFQETMGRIGNRIIKIVSLIDKPLSEKRTRKTQRGARGHRLAL
jgi:hypothetical protein